MAKKVALAGDLQDGRYPKFEDASMRLDDSVFLYDGHPVYGKFMTQENVNLFPMVPGHTVPTQVSYNDPLISFKHLDIGFINIGTKLFHLSRMPVRKQKQGLNLSNVLTHNWVQNVKDFRANHTDFSYIRSEAAGRALLGEYPEALVSFNQFKNFNHPTAVSNRIAIVPGGTVFFDLVPIGEIDSGKNTPYIKLYDTFADSVLVMHLASLGVETNA